MTMLRMLLVARVQREASMRYAIARVLVDSADFAGDADTGAALLASATAYQLSAAALHADTLELLTN